MEAREVREAFRDATLRRDAGALTGLFADDVTFRSPVVPFPFEGREVVVDIYRAVFAALGDFELLAEVGGGDGPQVLRFGSSLRGRELQTAVFLTAEDGRVREIIVFVRPLAGAAAVAAALAGPLARGPVRRLVLVALSAPLAAVVALAEPLLRRLLRTR